jgi:predicted Zn-dependent protease
MAVNPRLPGLAYCLGQALLVIQRQPQEACTVFEEGIRCDPGNAGLYITLDAAMDAQNVPAADRAVRLERYPSGAAMPDKLARLLIDTLRKAGRAADADRLEQRHHFFAIEH